MKNILIYNLHEDGCSFLCLFCRSDAFCGSMKDGGVFILCRVLGIFVNEIVICKSMKLFVLLMME